MRLTWLRINLSVFTKTVVASWFREQLPNWQILLFQFFLSLCYQIPQMAALLVAYIQSGDICRIVPHLKNWCMPQIRIVPHNGKERCNPEQLIILNPGVIFCSLLLDMHWESHIVAWNNVAVAWVEDAISGIVINYYCGLLVIAWKEFPDELQRFASIPEPFFFIFRICRNHKTYIACIICI